MGGISGKIQGVVVDEETTEPIPYANIIILQTDIGTATDERGDFFILNIPPGKYTIEVSYVGYQTKRIENIEVEIDQTVRLKVALLQTPIEIPPITVTSEMPAVKKDMVGTTYIVRKEELATLPIDYSINLVTFQPAVARADTAIHVRGGRATEVQYMIDNVSLVDPQTGDLAINISKGIVDELIFLPGGFDVEYGRAMSGVVNLISIFPQNKIHIKTYAKTERIMPFYYDFGYDNYQSTIHIPVSKRFKGLVSFDVMHTDDWDPRLYILPHKQRDDYLLYGKWVVAPSSNLKLTLSGALSRTQFDRYSSEDRFYKFHLDHYRSDMRKSNLQVFNVTYLPNTRYLFNITFSRLYTKRRYGVREQEEYGLSKDFEFRDYNTLEWPMPSNRNPFGATYVNVLCEGDYPEYQDKSSHVLKTHFSSILQIHKYHEIKTGIEYSYLDMDNFTYFISDSLNQLTDIYNYQPKECAFYIQDNVDFKGLYAKIGCRCDYFLKDPSEITVINDFGDTTWINVEFIRPTLVISPRLGFSFMVTDKFLFRANIGRYVQPPLYDYMYGYYNLLPFPSYLYKYTPLVGNPNLGPERTTSYEIGLQGEIRKNLSVTVNAFFKDVTDLIGTRYVPSLPRGYSEYLNVEYANIKGLEAIFEFANPIYTGKLSYTLSWARGTSSYAFEYADTSISRPATEYPLDFDQRHRVFIQGIVNLPLKTKLYLFGYFGEGFPYTPPGPEGKYEERNILRLPFQKQIDCVLARSFKIGKISLSANLEIINLLDSRYEIAPHYPLIPLEEINKEEFTSYVAIVDSEGAASLYYSPAADQNHDGLITPAESYIAFRELIKATDDWVNAYTAPRRARAGITVMFN